MTPQQKRLHEYLIENNSITGIAAWQSIGIYRLASRIHDLKNQGIKITDRFINVKNRFGEQVRVKEYKLEK